MITNLSKNENKSKLFITQYYIEIKSIQKNEYN